MRCSELKTFKNLTVWLLVAWTYTRKKKKISPIFFMCAHALISKCSNYFRLNLSQFRIVHQIIWRPTVISLKKWKICFMLILPFFIMSIIIIFLALYITFSLQNTHSQAGNIQMFIMIIWCFMLLLMFAWKRLYDASGTYRAFADKSVVCTYINII